ncbi:MAG: DUF4417 domain-containing protein [bacterium]|nr:DUF4417 domain-containing protein [bacterium]
MQPSLLCKSHKLRGSRPGIKDIWNAFMVKGATFTKNDIPICPTTATETPKDIIPWTEAKRIYKRERAAGKRKFHISAFVCFYLDDYKFDGPTGIWHKYAQALRILRHFDGVITPDFSTYQDFAYPIKLGNTYRMRAFVYWLGTKGIPVINNVRWGTPETYSYCFDGIEQNSIVAIGTVGSSPRKLIDRPRFEAGLKELVRVLKPRTIIVYGSDNYPCFDELRKQDIEIIAFKSHTAQAYERRQAQ